MLLNHLHYGDCLHAMTSLPDRSVHLVLADLPDGRTKLRGKRLVWNKVVDLEQLWSSLRRVCCPNAAMVFFASQPFASHLVVSNPKSFRFDMVWKKSRPTNTINARTQPMRAHEHLLVFADRPPRYHPQRTEGHSPVYDRRDPRYGSTTRLATSVLDFQSGGQNGRILAVQKPEALLRHLILSFTRRGELVLDPTAGSGSTLVAAKQLGRKFVGFEIDGETVVRARKRIQETTTLELCR
jgi:site-specific DNA-methyltransferase (adenine-specific)